MVVEQVLDGAQDELWQLVFDACAKVLLKITDHCENILFDAQISNVKEFSQNQNEI